MSKKPNPLDGAVDLKEVAAEYSALAIALGDLRREHNLNGCILISFTAERVGINTSARTPEFLRPLQWLADTILADISSGKLDPPADLEN